MRFTEIRSFWPTRTTANLMAVFSVLAVVLALGTQPISTISLMLVVVLVTTYTWVGFLLLTRVRPRPGTSLTLLTAKLGVAIIAIGASRGWLFSTANDFLGVQDPVPLELRVLNSTISTMVWAVAILAIEARISGYRKAFREKLIQKSSQATTSTTGIGLVSHELPGTAELNRLQENLREITEGLKAENHSNNALPIAAKEIQQQIAQLLRPLSHRIWYNAEKNRPQFHLPGLLSQALRTLNINALLTVTVGSGIFLLGSLSLVSLQESLLRTLGYTFSLGLSLLVLKKALVKRPKRTSVGVVILLAIATITIFGSELLASFVLYGEPATSYPLVAIAGPLSTLALLTLASVLGQLDEDWKLIDSMLDSSEIGLKSTATDIRFASFLHNSLQSELNGIALNLGEQVDRDSPKVRALLERLERISTESIADRYLASQLRDHEYLVEMVEAWSPLIAIDLDISPAVASHSRLPLLIELAEESISNAVRHSDTKEISLSAKVVDQDIVVVVSHPAKNLTLESKKLGAGWLAGYSKSHKTTWGDGKRKLVVVL